MDIKKITKIIDQMEAKALIDTLAEGLAKAEVKTLYDTLVKVESQGEAGQNTRAQASRVVKKVDRLRANV